MTPSVITLEQLCRALAAHALLAAYPDKLHEFFAPETAEQTAQFIYQFAMGEPVDRPRPAAPQDSGNPDDGRPRRSGSSAAGD